MRWMKPGLLLALSFGWLLPFSPSALPAQGSAGGLAAQVKGLPDFSPQAIRKARAKLYFAEARQPLAKLAPQVYRFASNSERCRINSGAQACDLPSDPLKGSDLKQVFKYYVKQPVEAALDKQQFAVHKSDWTWQPTVSRPYNTVSR